MTPRRHIAMIAAVLAAALSTTTPAAAQTKANQLFGAKSTAATYRPSAIGSYAKGCGAGFVQLPETGPTWQAMRLSRNRNWGHPELVDYLQDLSREAARLGWRGLYIGDMSQPRGGPMTSGHASHQIGLDADIWMKPALDLGLSRRAREKLSSINVRSKDQRSINGNFTATHAALLETAARDPRVDRIFVTPPVKIALCKSASRKDKKWLQKIRPYWGHNYHFHVRLKCPAGSPACVTQKPTVAQLSNGGDGCDSSLNWWVTDALRPPKKTTKPAKPAPKKRGARDYTMADLPRQCQRVLDD